MRLHYFAPPDLARLLSWCGGSPWRWLAVLAAAGPWLRLEAGPVAVYPLHVALTALLGWGLIGRERGSLASEVPLLPGAILIAWLALVTLFRAQWWTLGGTLLGGASLWIWGWAASGVGRHPGASRYFGEAALLYLAATVLVGLAAWALQFWAPQACGLINCDARAGVPYPFRGGWHSTGQYAVLLILLSPLAAAALVRSLRDPRAGRARVALFALSAAAGLALLAGARWWVLLIVGLGQVLFARVIAADRHPLDRLLMRGLVFFTLFGAVSLYGMVPGYLGMLLSGRDDARSVGIYLPPGAPPALTSDHTTPVPIRLVNAGWTGLRTDESQPLTVSVLLVFTTSTGQTQTYPGGALAFHEPLAPGQAVELAVPVRLPHWVNTGFALWQVHDAAGTEIPVTEGSHGFRFANSGYYALDQWGENHLTALAARARAFVTRAQPPPQDAVNGSGESLAGNAFDAIFFSPVWGHRPLSPPGFGPLSPGQPLWLQLLHGYGLVGLGLAAWLGMRLFRQSWHLSQAHERGGTRLAWRLVPVSTFLLATLGMLSGELSRYHSLWGVFLLSGFVEGAHARQFPGVPRLSLRGLADVNRWRAGLDRFARPRIPWSRQGGVHQPRGRFIPRLLRISWPRMQTRHRSLRYLPGAPLRGRRWLGRLPKVGWPRITWPRLRWPRRRRGRPSTPRWRRQ
jgi:hypothetical protein